MKGSRHRCQNYAAYQRNLPRSPFREGDTVTVNGERAIAVRKNYLTSEWVVGYPDGREDTLPESAITTFVGGHTDHE